MPIFIDRHYLENATQNSIELAHQMDLNIESEYNVKFLTYWFDEERSTAFCLVDAPDKESLERIHKASHGQVPNEIIEVDPAIVESFLGRIKDPTPNKNGQETKNESAFRGIMFTDLKDSTMMTTILGDTKALHLLHLHNLLIRNAFKQHNGREIKHTGDGFMASFISITDQIECAVTIQRAFSQHNKNNLEEELYVKIGLSAGEPIEEHGDLFGSAVQLAARLCSHAQPEQIVLAQVVLDQIKKDTYDCVELEEMNFKGFTKAIKLYTLTW